MATYQTKSVNSDNYVVVYLVFKSFYGIGVLNYKKILFGLLKTHRMKRFGKYRLLVCETSSNSQVWDILQGTIIHVNQSGFKEGFLLMFWNLLKWTF